jgi:uncharacterized protein (DUF1778 family)
MIGLYCQCKHVASIKEGRLQVRIRPRDKRIFEQAAEAEHLSVSAFVLQAAELHAEDVLAERRVISLSPKAAQAFNEALKRPAQVNQRLAEALKRSRNFAWID